MKTLVGLFMSVVVLFGATFASAQEVPSTEIYWSYQQIAATTSNAQVNHEWGTLCAAFIAMDSARPNFYWGDDYRRIASCNQAGISFGSEQAVLQLAAQNDNKRAFNGVTNLGIIRLRAMGTIGLVVEAGQEAQQMLEQPYWTQEEENALSYLVFQMMVAQQIVDDVNDMRGGGVTNFPVERIYQPEEIESFGLTWIDETGSYDSRAEFAYWLYKEERADEALELIYGLQDEFGNSDLLWGTEIQYLGGISNDATDDVFALWEESNPCSNSLINWQVSRRYEIQTQELAEEQWRESQAYLQAKIDRCGTSFELEVLMVYVQTQIGMPGIPFEEGLFIFIQMAHENPEDPRYWWQAASEALDRHSEIPMNTRLQDETFIQLALQGDLTYRFNLGQ